MEKPLAFYMRPEKLEDIYGQDHLIGDGKILTQMIAHKKLFSMIFYGPPGSGKTTLALAIVKTLQLPYRLFNATTDNKKILDTIFKEASAFEHMVVIIDEIHRLNKDKQDLLLSYMEDGTITVIGATTANPLFSINPAIRSRCQLFPVHPLQVENMKALLSNVCQRIHCQITEEALLSIINKSNGDVRYAINLIDMLRILNTTITLQDVQNYSFNNTKAFKSDDYHYNLLSAFQKSIRGSDVNAALYYLAQLIEQGDMTSIERRLLIIAYEDIGLSNPYAVDRTYQAIQSAKVVGFPEAAIPLGFAVIDLTLSPKSRSTTEAIHKAIENVQSHAYDIPEYLHYKRLEASQEGTYDYHKPETWAKIQYLPDALKNMLFYQPHFIQGYEAQLYKNYETLLKINRKKPKDL